ncbi:MAG: hypothetical protein KJ767_01460 [Nanoarchaeota archaeon]|nr:hypothetical protein [Nanoarchaeota archaeon]
MEKEKQAQKKIKIAANYPESIHGNKYNSSLGEFEKYVTSPTTGNNYHLVDNEFETEYECPIDKTKLVCLVGGYGEKDVSCLECNFYAGDLNRIRSQEQINAKAKSHLESLVKKNKEIQERTKKETTLNNWILELAKKNNLEV